jgi:hypothetical protein
MAAALSRRAAAIESRSHDESGLRRSFEGDAEALGDPRTFTAQTEALTKIKRDGEQTVRGEHVHVYPGGQANVGALSNRKVEGPVEPMTSIFMSFR